MAVSRAPRSSSHIARALVVAFAALLTTLAAGLAGCPTRDVAREPALEPDAVRALELYREALVAGRPVEAFALIHPEAREGLDERGFVTLFERHREALVAQADRLLATARATRPIERAEVQTDRGVVVLERTPDGWRLTAPVGAGAAPGTPTGAP